LRRGLAHRCLPGSRAAQDGDLGRLGLVVQGFACDAHKRSRRLCRCDRLPRVARNLRLRSFISCPATLSGVKRCLVAAAAALALATPALAALPQVHARAYVIEDGATGQVLADYREQARVPIASLTKLMTVLLTVENTKPSDVVTVAPGAAAVGESSIELRPRERLTVRDLLEGALIQSANDAADALAYYVGKGSEARFVAMMNARARQLCLSDTHYARPDGLDAPGHVSSARDVTKLARLLMRKPIVRSIVRRRTATIAGGRVLHTWNDLLASFPGVFGVTTGHTSAARAAAV